MLKKSELPTSSTQRSRRFKLSEIRKATKDFDESLVIGKGCFGKVYKGEIFDGVSVLLTAVKRFDAESKIGATKSWPWPGVERISTLRHRNLVSLIGYCNDVKQVKMRWCPWKLLSLDEKETILVYEYVPNGTLKDHLHQLHTPLSLLRRLNICIDSARGLHFLHTDTRSGTETGVMHGDMRSSNILLTESWVAKISDFGLLKIGQANEPVSRIIMHPNGSVGYLDPYTYAFGRPTMKSDVYSFGVVLLEVLCRKPALDDSRDDKDKSLVVWFQDSDKERNLEDIIDSEVRNEIYPKCLKEFFGIVERCLDDVPGQRPDMAEVVRGLESILALQQRFNKSVQPADSQSPAPSMKEFTFNDLEKATKGFSRDLLLAEGKVFLGWVQQNTLAPSEEGVGIAIAVKWITSEIPRSYNEWMEEVNFLEELAHPNIVRLLGYCSRDGHEHLLVYEHMEKSLSHYIHGDDHLEPLSWGTRLQIMIGVARGLMSLYLTKGILCHFQCSDILLDEEFNAKIGGFRWMKILERHDRIRRNGSYGYVQANYEINTGELMKNDICSFGLVVLQTITGRRLADFEDIFVGLESLEMRAPKSKSNKRKVKKMMDPRLKNNYSIKGAFRCMALALRCIAIRPESRPSREELVWSLEHIYAINK